MFFDVSHRIHANFSLWVNHCEEACTVAVSDSFVLSEVKMLTAEQQEIFEYIHPRKSGLVFLRGKGGSGKSYLIKELLGHADRKNYHVLVPANLAKSVCPGTAKTMHQFFYKAFDDLDNSVQRPDRLTHADQIENRWVLSGIRSLDALIIDEMMNKLMTGEYLKQKKALEEAIPLRKKGHVNVLSSSIGAACAGLAELKAALLAGEQRAACVAAA